MKKLLISILIILLFMLSMITIFKGFSFAGIEIPSINQLKQKSGELDASISEATLLASSDYKNVLDDMNSDIQKLSQEKKNYESIVGTSGTTQTVSSSQYQKYEIEYLWTVIGNHATSEGVVLKMDLVSGTSEENYNLNFTVTGKYIGIVDFISSIENDSVLGFKIENFALEPGASTDDLQATFTCKDITITDINQDKNEENKSTETVKDSKTTNTSNTSNTVNESNTTSTTNTTN